MATEIKYVQLEPGAFIGDIDFQIMTDRQRGVYMSLILYLYSNGGILPNDVQTLFKLCSSTLENFNKDWEVVKHKFIINGTISHKRVDEEIERATSFYNKKRAAGLKSGESRRKKAQTQDEHRSNTARTQPELSKVKLSEVKKSKENDLLYTPPVEPKYEIYDPQASKRIRETFTEEEFNSAGVLIGIDEKLSSHIYNHYKSQGFLKTNGLPLADVKSALITWRNNEHKFAPKGNTNGKPTEHKTWAQKDREAIKEKRDKLLAENLKEMEANGE